MFAYLLKLWFKILLFSSLCSIIILFFLFDVDITDHTGAQLFVMIVFASFCVTLCYCCTILPIFFNVSESLRTHIWSRLLSFFLLPLGAAVYIVAQADRNIESFIPVNGGVFLLLLIFYYLRFHKMLKQTESLIQEED